MDSVHLWVFLFRALNSNVWPYCIKLEMVGKTMYGKLACIKQPTQVPREIKKLKNVVSLESNDWKQTCSS